MANGQTFGGGFDPRFQQAPIVEGQPVGTVPGERRLGEGGVLSNVRPPERPGIPPELQELANTDPRQVAQKAGDAFFSLVFSANAQFRNFKSGQAPRFAETMNLLLPQIQQAGEVYGDAREAAGLDRATADRALAKFEDSIPQVPITLTKVGQAENLVAVRSPVGEIPTAEIVSRGQPPTPRVPTKPPEFIAVQNRRNQLSTVASKLRREGRTDALKLVQTSIKELDAKIAKESTPKEPTSALFDVRKGKTFLKPAVSNSLRQSVARLFGGALDPATGKFILLDPTQGPKAVAVNALAEAMILSGDETSVANAVQAAGRSFGVSFPSTEDASATEETLRQGRDSIKQGADPEAVKARLREMGIDPDLL